MNDVRGQTVVVIDAGSVVPQKMRYERGRVQRLVDASIGASFVDMHINSIFADSAPGPYHLHNNAENVYYVLAGEASIRSGAETYLVTAGQAAFIPPGIPHAISWSGGGELLILEIYAPADADFEEVTE